MQNIDACKPTKFCLGERDWEGNSDPRHLHVASRYTATRAVRVYQSAIEQHARGHLVLADLSLTLRAQRTRHGLEIANKVSFLLLEKGPLRRFSDRSMAKMPLGHVVVAQKPSGAGNHIPSP